MPFPKSKFTTVRLPNSYLEFQNAITFRQTSKNLRKRLIGVPVDILQKLRAPRDGNPGAIP